MEEETTVCENDTENKIQAEVADETVKLVYVGPSIPRSALRNNMVLSGTETEIKEFIEPLREPYPEIKFLLVPVHKLAEAQKKLCQKGNILAKYYSDMAAKARVYRKG